MASRGISGSSHTNAFTEPRAYLLPRGRAPHFHFHYKDAGDDLVSRRHANVSEKAAVKMRPVHDASPFRRILVRATNWVGDAVMSLPALGAIRRAFPTASIAVVARPWVLDLYRREPFLDEVIPYTAPRGASGLAEKWRFARSLSERNFDCAILLQNAFEAALLVWLARIPRRIGYARDGRGWLLTDPVPVPKTGEIPRHERFYYVELLRRAGLISEAPGVNAVRLAGADAAREAGFKRYAELGVEMPVVGVSPGAAYGGAKRWLPERFAASAAELARQLGGTVAVFGAGNEVRLCETVEALARQQGAPVRQFGGKTSLAEFIELAAACEVFFANDSGAMHIVSALGVPVVAVFGATDPLRTGPTGEHARVIQEEVECAPCLLRECPIDHRCMTRVTVQRVVDEALAMLRRARSC